jgi:hypothetical protein
VAIATARLPKAVQALLTLRLKMVLSGASRGVLEMANPQEDKVQPFEADRSFPTVLLYSTACAIVSLCSVWIVTATSFASPVLGA